MGQTSSNSNRASTIQLTKDEIRDLFYTRCLLLLKPYEVHYFKELSGDDLDYLDLARSLKLIPKSIEKETTMTQDFKTSIETLFNIVKTLGLFPFLHDDKSNARISVKELIIATILLSGRYKKIIKRDFDFQSVIYRAMCHLDKTGSKDLKNDSQTYEVTLLLPFDEEDNVDIKSKKINWTELVSFVLPRDKEQSKVNAKILQNVIALLLIVNSVDYQSKDYMSEMIHERVKQWDQFRQYSLYLLRYLNNELQSENLNDEEISFDDFQCGVTNIIPQFFEDNFKKIIRSTIFYEAIQQSNVSLPQRNKDPKFDFEESSLVTHAFISYLSTILKGINVPIELNEHNMVKLYSGSETGFSIKTLETKIFKWQAPTLVVISGKRISSKTLTNKRYQDFEEEYPAFFRSNESKLQDWQKKNDRIKYAVLVNEPWRNSNKANFGDELSTIFSIQPRADYYKSIHSDIIKGKSIYFNNLGMGLGFGNSQPLNKNNIKKLHPGDVSLTIESNLEYAVFRHLVTSNDTSFFCKSQQKQLKDQDFEDRFSILSLEVWGIGSNAELEEQKKHWEWEEKQAKARQSINLRSLGEERSFLEMAGLVGNNGNGGSV